VEAGGVGRGAAAGLQVVTLEEFLEVYDGYIGANTCEGWGVFESLGYFACGPVAMVRMQKVGIKYKKPIVFLRCAQGAFQPRIKCDDVVAGMGRGPSNLGGLRAGPVD
jgi:hypothetical protein